MLLSKDFISRWLLFISLLLVVNSFLLVSCSNEIFSNSVISDGLETSGTNHAINIMVPIPTITEIQQHQQQQNQQHQQQQQEQKQELNIENGDVTEISPSSPESSSSLIPNETIKFLEKNSKIKPDSNVLSLVKLTKLKRRNPSQRRNTGIYKEIYIKPSNEIKIDDGQNNDDIDNGNFHGIKDLHILIKNDGIKTLMTPLMSQSASNKDENINNNDDDNNNNNNNNQNNNDPRIYSKNQELINVLNSLLKRKHKLQENKMNLNPISDTDYSLSTSSYESDNDDDVGYYKNQRKFNSNEKYYKYQLNEDSYKGHETESITNGRHYYKNNNEYELSNESNDFTSSNNRYSPNNKNRKFGHIDSFNLNLNLARYIEQEMRNLQKLEAECREDKAKVVGKNLKSTALASSYKPKYHPYYETYDGYQQKFGVYNENVNRKSVNHQDPYNNDPAIVPCDGKLNSSPHTARTYHDYAPYSFSEDGFGCYGSNRNYLKSNKRNKSKWNRNRSVEECEDKNEDEDEDENDNEDENQKPNKFHRRRKLKKNQRNNNSQSNQNKFGIKNNNKDLKRKKNDRQSNEDEYYDSEEENDKKIQKWDEYDDESHYKEINEEYNVNEDCDDDEDNNDDENGGRRFNKWKRNKHKTQRKPKGYDRGGDRQNYDDNDNSDEDKRLTEGKRGRKGIGRRNHHHDSTYSSEEDYESYNRGSQKDSRGHRRGGNKNNQNKQKNERNNRHRNSHEDVDEEDNNSSAERESKTTDKKNEDKNKRRKTNEGKEEKHLSKKHNHNNERANENNNQEKKNSNRNRRSIPDKKKRSVYYSIEKSEWIPKTITSAKQNSYDWSTSENPVVTTTGDIISPESNYATYESTSSHNQYPAISNSHLNWNEIKQVLQNNQQNIEPEEFVAQTKDNNDDLNHKIYDVLRSVHPKLYTVPAVPEAATPTSAVKTSEEISASSEETNPTVQYSKNPHYEINSYNYRYPTFLKNIPSSVIIENNPDEQTQETKSGLNTIETAKNYETIQYDQQNDDEKSSTILYSSEEKKDFIEVNDKEKIKLIRKSCNFRIPLKLVEDGKGNYYLELDVKYFCRSCNRRRPKPKSKTEEVENKKDE